jgi:hypothetical protein
MSLLSNYKNIALEKTEFEKIIIDALKGDVKVTYILMVRCNLKLKEILSLHPSDICLKRHILLIKRKKHIIPIQFPLELAGIFKLKLLRMRRIENQLTFFSQSKEKYCLFFSELFFALNIQTINEQTKIIYAILVKEINYITSLLSTKPLAPNRRLRITPPKSKRPPFAIKPQQIVTTIGQKEF